MREPQWIILLRLAGLMTMLLGLAAAPARAADQSLLLDVQINGYAIGLIGEFTLRDGVLLAQTGELLKLGLKAPSTVKAGVDGRIGLSQVPGLAWRLDLPNQEIFFTVADMQRVPVQVGPRSEALSDIAIQSGTGLTLNYDVAGTSADGTQAASGLFDLRGFSLWGVANTGFLVRAGTGSDYTVGTQFIRLDTAYQYSDVASLRRYTLGDFISGDLSWTRPVRLAGAQLRSDFSMRPDLITFPLPSVSGTAAVPSTLDVFTNGVRTFSENVAPGPFVIPQLPVVSGAGTVSMTLTNALGNQITTTMPFYASPTLLAPGLQTYSAQGGLVRRYFGLLSNAYGDAAASAVYRRGLTQDLTVEATAETSQGMTMAGAGVVLNLFDLAVINVAGSASQGASGTGTQLSLGLQHTGSDFSYSGTALIADRHYRDIAAVNGDSVPLLQLTGNLGYSLGAWGNLGIAYARIDRPAPTAAASVPSLAINSALVNGGIDYLGSVQRARLLSASYSVQIEGLSFFATGYHNFSATGGSGILLGLTMPIGSRSSVSANVGESSAGPIGQVQAQQSVSSVGDWGYQTYASGGNDTHVFGQAQYKSRFALLTAGIDHLAGQTTLQLQAQGAVSLMEGTFFASNAIPDSFALVKTGGLPDIHVLQDNRDVGTTNYRGMLVVPDLRSYEVNHISIAPSDIPLDASIDATVREVRPQDRSGIVVAFAVQVSHGALLQVVDEKGHALPVGSVARLQANQAIVPFGYDGYAYLENLAPHNVITVEKPDGARCSVAFDYVGMRGVIPKIGPLHCATTVP